MKFLLDANGLDDGSSVVIDAGRMAREKLGIDITIIGKADIEDAVIKSGCKFLLASEEISTDEHNPAFAIRNKKDSSITKGLYALKKGEYDAFISGGSTGAVFAGASLIVGRIPGVDRAALMVPVPTVKGFSYMIDAGANVDCTPEMLKNFAIIASNYVKLIKNVEHPSVMLINNGIEESKGTALTRETYKLLKESDLNFKGNLEARYIFDGEAGIIVTDGFSGNLLLKGFEGEFRFVLKLLKDTAYTNIFTKLGMLLIKKHLKNNFKKLDANQYGGVPIMGLKKVVVKAHGNSNAEAFYNSIKVAKETYESNLIEYLTNLFQTEV